MLLYSLKTCRKLCREIRACNDEMEKAELEEDLKCKVVIIKNIEEELGMG